MKADPADLVALGKCSVTKADGGASRRLGRNASWRS